MPDKFVLDASALLCLLNGEEGAERVAAIFEDAIISAVNCSEDLAKIVERGGSLAMVEATLDPLRLRIADFNGSQALRAGALRAVTRPFGLSFGDRACLALAATRGLIAITGDRAWSNLNVGVVIEVMR